LVISFIPTLVRIGTQVGPVLLNEVAKPRFRKFLRKTLDEGLGTALKFGKKRLARSKSRKTFIMRRGRQRFECRKVK